VKKKLHVLWMVMVVLGAVGMEIQERYLSSPSPAPQLRRTAATLGRNGETVYVAPHVRIIAIGWFVLTLGVLVLACSTCGLPKET